LQKLQQVQNLGLLCYKTYKTPAVNWDMEPVEKDLKEMGIGQLGTRPELSLSRTNLPTSPLVFLLNYYDLSSI
jgi:hypothetical protein